MTTVYRQYHNTLLQSDPIIFSSLQASHIDAGQAHNNNNNNNNNNNLFILSAKIYNNLWHWKFSILGEFDIKSFMRRWE